MTHYWSGGLALKIFYLAIRVNKYKKRTCCSQVLFIFLNFSNQPSKAEIIGEVILWLFWPSIKLTMLINIASIMNTPKTAKVFVKLLRINLPLLDKH